MTLDAAPFDIREDDTTPLTPEWYLRTDDLVMSSRRALAFVEGTPVGAVWFGPFGDPTISAVFVLPTFRGAGIATALYEFAAQVMGVAFDKMVPVAGTWPGGRGLANKLGIAINPHSAKR